MERAGDTVRFRLALAAALVLGLFASGFAGVEAPRASAAPAPRLTLTVPAEVTQATPAIAKGKVMPAQRDQVLLRV